MLALGGADPLGQIDFLRQLTLPRVSTGGGTAPLPNKAPLVEEVVLLAALLTDLGVLRLHVPVEVRLGRLLEQVLLGRQLGNLRLHREHYLFPLGPLHVVILVDPAILILLLVRGVCAVIGAITATPSLATSALLALLHHRSIIAVAIGPLRRIRRLSSSLRPPLLLALIVLVARVLFTAAPTTSTRCLGTGIAAIGCIVVTSFVLGSASSAELLSFFLDFRHVDSFFQLVNEYGPID